MALFNKIFSGRKRGSKNNLKYEAYLEDSCWKPPPFSKDQIRVLLFRECDGRSRKLLFDSASVKKIEPSPARTQSSSNILSQKLRRCPPPPKTSSKPELSNSEGLPEITNNDVVYKYLRPQPDVKMLEEMIFGSVAMSFQGTTTKLHVMKAPLQVMFSKVLPAPNPQGRQGLSDSLSNSFVECVYVRQSDHLERLSSSVGSAEIPDWHTKSFQELDYSLGLPMPLRSTSSLNSLLNVQNSSPDPYLSRLHHSGSYNSLQRRWLRCRTTSMEFGFPRKGDDRGSFSDNPNGLSSHKRSKLGMSVIISLGDENFEDKQFQTFFFSHITLIENHVNQLLREVERAYQDRNSFVKILMESYEALQKSISDLYTTPRLPNPVWLTMMTNHSHHHVICLKFMTEFMSLVEQYDVKITKFFVSTLLTAVLSHHLAWVPTITPPGIPTNHAYYEKHTAKWLHMLAKSHPYNPLWVQLGDLYGAIGFPRKMAKTIIIGKKADVVKRFLYVLSYFIRCSEVYENLEQKLPHNVPKSYEQHDVQSAEERNDEKTEQNSCTISNPDSLEESGHHEGDESVETRVVCEANLHSSDSDRNSCCELCSGRVFDENLRNKEIDVLLRPGRIYCDACRKLVRRANCNSNVRNGRIFDVAVEAIKDPVKNEENDDESKVIDRDSGISGCEEQQSESTTTTMTESSKSSSVSSPKVSFTIGDIPLEEICLQEKSHLLHSVSSSRNHHLKHKDSPKSHFYVCNCRIHPKQAKRLDVGLENSNNKLVKSQSVGKSLATYETDENFGGGSDGSFACDSGIHSTEQSSCDVSGLVVNHCRVSSLSKKCQQVPKIAFDGNCVNSRWEEGDVKSIEVQDGLITDFVGISDDKVALLRNLKKGSEEGEWTKPYDKCKKIEICLSCEDRFHGKGAKCCFSNCETTTGATDEKEVVPKRTGKPRKMGRKNPNRRRLCKCNSQSIPPTVCPCRSQSDENLNKSCVPRQKTRSRHKSEAGLPKQLDYESEIKSFLFQAVELPLPKSELKQAVNSSAEYFRGFAWSLVCNYSDHYMADFTLQGTDESEFGQRLCSDLALSVSNPSVDEPIAEAVCILADIDKWSVQLTSNKTCNVETGVFAGIPVGMSQLIANMTETLLHLWKLKMSPEFCLMHLEDRLQEIYFKSRLLAEYLIENSMCDIEEMTNALGLDASDLPLLMAVASTHTPSVTCTYNVPYR